MDRNVIILVLALSLLAVSLFAISFRNKISKRDAEIQAAKALFLKSLGSNVSIDSTYISNDTLRYYSHDSFIGKSIMVTE